MIRRLVTVVVVVALLNLTVGCTSRVIVGHEDVSTVSERIVSAVLTDGRKVDFDFPGGRYVPGGDIITGMTTDGEIVVLPLEDVLYVQIKRTDTAKSIVATVGVLTIVALAMGAIVLATKESCPFVYSFDGAQFVFDAEPLGGAVCKGLERTDYCRLEYLRVSNGHYHLLVRNEVHETQYLDELKLAIIDHPPDLEVVPDAEGRLHFVSEPIAPLTATDENGRDLSRFVRDRDGIAWQTMMTTDKEISGSDIRHHLTFTFPKPSGADSAKLIVNGGTALWGSSMIRQMLQMRGAGVDRWYEGMSEMGPEVTELHAFNMREELYWLKCHVKKGDSWVERALIMGGGPLVTEDRIIHLDLSDIPGDTVTLRLNPPKGFWSIDYVSLAFETYATPDVQEVPISIARDHRQTDVADLLRDDDSRYYIMPRLKDWAELQFEEVSQLPGTRRTVFLKANGYYEIQIDKTQAEQDELIAEMLATPGAIVKYALDEFQAWRGEMLGGE